MGSWNGANWTTSIEFPGKQPNSISLSGKLSMLLLTTTACCPIFNSNNVTLSSKSKAKLPII